MGFPPEVIFDLPKEQKIFDCNRKDVTHDFTVPCSRPMCDECATEWEGMDFCPNCVDFVMREIIQTREVKKSVQRNLLKNRCRRGKRKL
jgi:hypothetical protein